MPEEGFYAQALDGEKRPVAAIASNPGHLLFCGLPSPERARLVAARLRRPDLDSGWGVRTLAAGMPTYNPMSYHNGSVWPHDNSLIAAGLARYGEMGGLERIAGALFTAAEHLPERRLPELYCGFPRNEEAAADGPVQYPVSCSPQAWAAGAAPLLMRAMLGLEATRSEGRCGSRRRFRNGYAGCASNACRLWDVDSISRLCGAAPGTGCRATGRLSSRSRDEVVSRRSWVRR